MPLRARLSCNQVFVVFFRRSTGRQRHLVPSPVSSPIVAFILCCALGVSVTRNVGIAVLCGLRELDSAARMRTDFDCSADAAAQCLQEFHLRVGTLERGMRASAKCLILEKSKLGVFTVLMRLSRHD